MNYANANKLNLSCIIQCYKSYIFTDFPRSTAFEKC